MLVNMTRNGGRGAADMDRTGWGSANAAMAAVIADELADRRWSPEFLETKSDILKYRTIYRMIRNQKDITIQEVFEMARLLEMPAEELMRRAAAREERDARLGTGVPDPAAAARYLLAHPDEDGQLVRHLGELESQLGDHPEKLQHALDAARYEREQQLRRWLD
jgi:hypothetical protein